jgi:hypothetical protein
VKKETPMKRSTTEAAMDAAARDGSDRWFQLPEGYCKNPDDIERTIHWGYSMCNEGFRVACRGDLPLVPYDVPDAPMRSGIHVCAICTRSWVKQHVGDKMKMVRTIVRLARRATRR